ncbi:50S ribosomal protein L24 [Zancudomyces culisetae]|uniref:50S ribosomal protein L24 n=1 Tax=Zancudomyces culisetae TaxID=1213189 RepID=A0A1R1PLF7_ZANCU|nr:50S ribosomal protein L24 [Zancudomyces culisetae]|eukprot:OMH81804.1 50S ribosomal protein L24 [Zancudomyces culisetae]
MKEMPVHVSNVMLVDPSNGLPTKVKVKAYYDPESGKKEHRRYAVGSGSYIAKPKYLEYQNAWVDGEKDTEPDDVTQVTYKSALGQRPMPSDVLKEIANRRGHVF